MSTGTNRGEYVMVYRSAWEDGTDEPYRETLQTASFRELVEKALETSVGPAGDALLGR